MLIFFLRFYDLICPGQFIIEIKSEEFYLFADIDVFDPSLSLRFVFSVCLVKMVYIVFPALRSIFHLSHHFSKCLITICRCLEAISCFSCV